jgi:plasmid replication initiation protein
LVVPEKAYSKASNVVTKSNLLIEANYKLGATEQKVILCVASNIQPTDSDFKTYTLSVKEFYKLLGLKGTPKYTELRKITKELMQKVFEARIENKVIQVAWLSYVAYNEKEGTIDMRFDPFLKPYLLQLKKEFTSYKLENVVKLKSSYAIRLYELLKQYEKLQQRTFKVGDLRQLLGAEDIYPAYGNFKQRVLIPAQKELKKKTDIAFEIEEIKSGRKIDKILFIINAKRKNQPTQMSLFPDGENKSSDSTFEDAKQLALRIGFQLNRKIFNQWVQYGETELIAILHKLVDRKDIENPIGYISKVLKDSSNSNVEENNNHTILFHLISEFKKNTTNPPKWLIKQDSIKRIQKKFSVNYEEACEIYNAIQSELFFALGVRGEVPEETSDEERKQLDMLLEELNR